MEMITRKRRLSDFEYTGGDKKRFKPVVKATFPMYVRPSYGLYNAKMRGLEKKFIDTASTITNLSTTPQLILLNGVTTGTDYNTRIGREIKMTSSYLRWNASTTVNAFIRVMLIYDKQPNGVAPSAVTDILVAQSMTSPNNLNNKDRFISISDKVYTFDTAGVLVRFAKKYKKLSTVCTYSGTGATVASIATGAYYLIVFSSSDTPSLTYYHRTRFVDQ